MDNYRLGELIDLAAVQQMADAHYQAAGMPIGIIDALDDSILVGVGWQDICVKFHRANPRSLKRCQASDNYIKGHLAGGQACHYKCKNGLWDIGVPIFVSECHLATMFLGQFFYAGEVPDRKFFTRQAQEFGFDLDDYLAALDRVPVFKREKVNDIVEYNQALVGFITSLAENSLLKRKAEEELEQRVRERTASLAEAEAKFRGLVENTMDIPFRIDAAGRLCYVGPQAERYGFDPAAIEGRAFLDLIMADDRKRVGTAFYKSLENGDTSPMAFRIQAPGGRVIWFEERSTLQRNGSGEIIGYTGVLRDVTERKRMEKVLKESEERYRNLFEAESSAILVFDAHTHRFVDVNPAAEKQYGYTRDEFLNLTYWDITCEPQASQSVLKRALTETLKEPIPLRWHRKKDGSVLPVEISPSKFTLEGRTVLGGIMRDITRHMEEQKQRDKHQKRLRRLAAKLATAQDEEQQRIAEGLHDDVAQDLALCNLKLALANREKDPAKADAIRDEIGELIHKTAEKIRSLSFELSSSSLYRIGFKEAIVELCNSMTKRYDVRFRVEDNDYSQMIDDTTAAVLFKAVRELFFNVVKHAGTKEATVFIIGDEQTLTLTVEDRGKGFSRMVDENCIDMGKGLGLFGIKERLRDLGGDLQVDSIPGGRTRVILQVPVGSLSRT